MNSLRRPSVFNVIGLAFVVAIVVVWQLVTPLIASVSSAFSSPTAVAAALAQLAAEPEFWHAIGHTMLVVAVSWCVASVIGTVLGIAFGSLPRVWRYGIASVDFFRSVPATALVPMALLVFGPTALSEYAVAIFVGTWPVIISAASGARDVSERQYEVSRQLQMSRFAVMRKVVLPCAVPKTLSGIRFTVSVVLVVVVLTEMLGTPLGIGYQLITWQQAMSPANVWAYVVVAGLLGWGINLLLGVVARRVLGASWPITDVAE
jgi:ABC-type nitrate/sulfonate/bicarbonate transport system permease component